MGKTAFCNAAYAKTKTQIAKLISTFDFASQIVQSLYFLNLKFQASSNLLLLYSLVCVVPGRKPRRQVFSSWVQGDLNNIAVLACCMYLHSKCLDRIRTNSIMNTLGGN